MHPAVVLGRLEGQGLGEAGRHAAAAHRTDILPVTKVRPAGSSEEHRVSWHRVHLQNSCACASSGLCHGRAPCVQIPDLASLQPGVPAATPAAPAGGARLSRTFMCRKASAFSLWLQMVRAARGLRALGRCCEERAALSVAAKAVVRWRIARSSRVRRAAVCQRAMHRRRSRIVMLAFSGWARECSWRRRTLPGLLRALARVANSRRAAMLRAWHSTAARRRASRAAAQNFARRSQTKRILVAFGTWRSFGKGAAALRAALQRLAQSLHARVHDHLATSTLQVCSAVPRPLCLGPTWVAVLRAAGCRRVVCRCGVNVRGADEP